MIRYALRQVAANRARVAMTMVAIVLGVTAAVAGWVAADSVAQTLADQPVRSSADLVVQPGKAALTRSDRDRIEELGAVRSAVGIVVGYAGLVGPNGKLVGSETPPKQAGTVVDTGQLGEGQRFLIIGGRVPRRAGEIAVGTAAIQDGVRVGSRVRVLVSDGTSVIERVTGSFRYAALGPAKGDEADPRPVVAFVPAQSHLVSDHLARIEVAIRPGSDPTAVAEAIRSSTPPGTRVVKASMLSTAMAAQAAGTAKDLRLTLLPFAAVAVLVGIFVIANTFTLLITERTRELALLRTIGAKRRQVRGSVIIEAAALGFIGGTLGGILGIAGAPLLMKLVGSDVPVELHVSPVAVAVAYGVGVLITVAAALGAAQRASQIAPMAALRQDTAEPRMALLRSTITGTILVAASVTGVLATARPDSANLPRIISLISVLAGCIGILVLAPQLVRWWFGPLSRRAIGDPFNRSGPPVGPGTGLALRNAVRDPRRTARTGTAVTVGLALICAFGTFSATLSNLVSSTVRANTPASTTILQPAAGGDATLSESDLAATRHTEGVSTAAAARDLMSDITVPSGSTRLLITAIEPSALGTVLTPAIIAGTDDLHRGVVVSKNQADMLKLRVGTRITLRPDGHTIRTKVVGLYDATELSASLFYDVDLAPPSVRAALTTIYATGHDPHAVRASLETRFHDRPDVTITDREGLAAQEIQEQQLAFVLVYAMFALSVIIAIFGVVNTLVLSVGQRTREFGVLRAIGGSRRLLIGMIRAESLEVAVFGALLGLVIGVLGGAVMQHAMLGQRITDAVLPYGVITGCLVGIVVAAVLASIWPATKAARVDVLAAVSST